MDLLARILPSDDSIDAAEEAYEKQGEYEFIQKTVFKLARSGESERLNTLLGTLNVDQLKRVLNASEPSVNGANPLIIAARSGHTKVVEVLLSRGADPHDTGTVTFDGEIITRVPPLWAASAAGHLDVCKLLVANGVNVNQTTNTNSTPLRGACYDGHLDIVKFLVDNGADIEIANRHGHTALMIASYREKVDVVRFLLSMNARIDRTSIKGNTVLHDAAEAGNSEILQILLKAGAKLQPDDYGVTPLLSAALSGHAHLMPLLIGSSTHGREKHDAWKLLGATVVDKRLDLGTAITYWKNAFDSEICDSIDNWDFVSELNDVQKKVYGGYRETLTLNEVNDLFGDPDAIRMQALIIRERILGDSHPDTHHYLRLRGAYYLDVGSWDRTWELWSYILQLEQFYHHPMSMATGSTFCAFYDAITIMIEELMRPERRQLNRNITPSIEQVVVILERAVYEAERYLYSDEESRSENTWAFDDRSVRTELENLIGLCLQFVHLISRVNLVTVIQPENASKSNSLNARAPILPPRTNLLGRSDGPSSANLMPFRSGSFSSSASSSNCYASPAPSPSSVVSRLTSSWKRPMHVEQPSYIITNTVNRKCPCAYLGKTFEQFPKLEFDGLQPRCPHLNCLVHRLMHVSYKLDIGILHMACEEREMTRDELDYAPRIPSNFVVEKLIHAGAKLNEADEHGNTPLHVLLMSSSMERTAIVKLLLDSGASLFARNRDNETCLDLIRKTSICRTIRIGRYLSLQQMAANVINRRGLDCSELPAELDKWLKIF